MPATWKFRLLVLLICIVVGPVAMANLVAELLRPAQVPIATRASKAPSPDQVSATSLASAIMPFRSDLKADYAQALAGEAIHSQSGALTDAEKNAQSAIRGALGIGPHDSRLWLVLAVLQARKSPVDPLIAESLKMSYLTGPNQSELIPVRLGIVTSNNSLSDSDLSELARGDVRALLMQLSGRRDELLDDYQRASEIGRKFLEESVKGIDPEFAGTLRGKK